MTATKKKETVADELDRHFFKEPSHGLLADILKRDAGKRIIYVPLNPRTGEHWYRNASVEYWQKMDGIRAFARTAGEDAVTRAFEIERIESGDVKKVFTQAGCAYQKVRTRDFLAGAITLFNEHVTVSGIQWNCTPECLPLLDGILDYSGKTLISRKAREDEYFRDPLPYRIEEILNAPKPEKWLTLLSQIHTDHDNFTMARQCYSLAMRGQATKLFQIWYNREGNAGKNTVIDALGVVLPGRVKPISSAVILKGGDSSERRFGAAEMEGALISYFDEVG